MKLCLTVAKTTLRTLRCGDYGLRTTAGSHFQDWDETRVFSHPTVASSRRCVVEGFYVVWKGGLRIHHKGMKKQFNARKLRNSCCPTVELQTNARQEPITVCAFGTTSRACELSSAKNAPVTLFTDFYRHISFQLNEIKFIS